MSSEVAEVWLRYVGRARKREEWQSILGIAMVVVLWGCGGSSGAGTRGDASADGTGKDTAGTAGRDGGGDQASGVEAPMLAPDGGPDRAIADAGLPGDAGVVDAGALDVPELADLPITTGLDATATTIEVGGNGADVATPDQNASDGHTTDVTVVDGQADDGSAQPFCASASAQDAGAVQRLCYDFSAPASAADFLPEAGTWVVANGEYEATGPAAQVTCASSDGSEMTASVLRGFSARDVRVHARLTSSSDPDKVLVFRSRPGGNRIEINFRANFVDNGVTQGGDLYIDALVDCANPVYVDVDTIHIPHAIGQAIVADVQLIGQHLTVAVDGKTVFDSTLSLPTDPGSVGFAVFRDASVAFDDFLVELLQ